MLYTLAMRSLLLFLASSLACHNGSTTKTTADLAKRCDIHWNEVRHDTFDPAYRSVLGPVTTGQTITLKLRTQKDDLSSARLRLWDDRLNESTYLSMQREASSNKDFDWWVVTFNTGKDPTILYYFFELNDVHEGCQDEDFYVDDDTQRFGGGEGVTIDYYDDFRSFQLTVYDPGFTTPAWARGAVVYQIFPDRFRDGDPSNNPTPGSFFYGEPGGILLRSGKDSWETPLCDPRGILPGACKGAFGQNFYGGDFQGITAAIQEGYFDALGVNVLYLNPVVNAISNHRYDPELYLEPDPILGTWSDFDALVAAAMERNIRVVLDGVFHHVSSDSVYFDRYHRYSWDGACESEGSDYRSMFVMPAKTRPAPEVCGGVTYDTFGGYAHLPKLNANDKVMRTITIDNAVVWTQAGAVGWRLDAAGELDPGPTQDPTNDFWEKFRARLKAEHKDELILGEAWGDAAPWLLGAEWDSATNYRLRGVLLNWLFSGCQGQGCKDGLSFSDNDSNAGSFTGEIKAFSPSQLHRGLLSIWEDYPPQSFYTMMNLVGSHDTNRISFLLQKISKDNAAEAQTKLRQLWLFLFSYPGMPTIYYADELGLASEGVFDGSTWQDDPYNRAPFPWSLQKSEHKDYLGRLAKLRRDNPVLQDGKIHHGLIMDDSKQVYGFGRSWQGAVALVVLNRGKDSQRVRLTHLSSPPYSLPEGAKLQDPLGGAVYTIQGGEVEVGLPAFGGVMLLGGAR